MAMTLKQAMFVDLEDQRKVFMDRFDYALRDVAAEVGVGNYFQSDDGVVYKIVEPAGRYVKFDKVSYVRTKRGEEKQGTLSVTEAHKAGFDNVILAIVALLLSLVFTPMAGATALGLLDGSYHIFADVDFNPANDGIGTMTIGPTGVEAFHMSGRLGEFDCAPCFTQMPFHHVSKNDPGEFIIADDNHGILTLDFPSHAFTWVTYTNDYWGTWRMAAIPEPISAALMALGGLGLWLRKKLT